MEQYNDWRQMGDRLSACRQNRNMTQVEFAGRIGITPQALSKWERGVSYPDVSMMAEVSQILGVSTDYLLGLAPRDGRSGGEDREAEKAQIEIGNRLLTACEPLVLGFDISLVPAIRDTPFVDRIAQLRKSLAVEGILMPVVRLMDTGKIPGVIDDRDFMVRSRHKLLYNGHVEAADEDAMEYMVQKLGECVRAKYSEILSPDLVKALVDNLKIQYPALIDGVVPERISYGLLTDVARAVLRKGQSICFLPRMIEGVDSVLREAEWCSRSGLTVDFMAQYICQELEK